MTKRARKAWNGGSREAALAAADERLEAAIALGCPKCPRCYGAKAIGGIYLCGVCGGVGFVLPPGGMPQPNPNWTTHQDEMLLAAGGAFGDGYAYIASHDFGKPEQEGRDRAAWLKKHRPLFVARVERDADR